MGLPVLKQDFNQIDEAAFTGTHLEASFNLGSRGALLMDIFNTYEANAAGIESVHKFLGLPNMSVAAGYVFAGRDSYSDTPCPSPIQSISYALKTLDVECWRKAFQLTEAYELMSQEDRKAWDKAFADRDVPEFECEMVLATLDTILKSKSDYFARRVASIFKNLSGKHVTNPAHAFNNRIIMTYAYNDSPSTERCGYINDLRFAISLFLGVEPCSNYDTYKAICAIYDQGKFGEWFDFDDGAFRIKLFKKGTAHIEIDDDMAWRLNVVLASLFGPAIPKEMRRTTASNERQKKYYQLREKVLSNETLRAISGANLALTANKNDFRNPYSRIANSISFLNSNLSPEAYAEIREVMIACGGTQIGHCREQFIFEYDFLNTVAVDILRQRCIPETKSHQFYATPDNESKELVELADIQEGMSVCEPSAGSGMIAKLLPKDVTCVEISPVRCKVLEAMGLNTVCADFLEWAQMAPTFDRIVMNPPFSEGRAIRHVEAAMSLLKPRGILTAILPCTLHGKISREGFKVEWQESRTVEFEGAVVNVRMVKIIRA